MAWLKEYRERKEKVRQIHAQQTLDLSALGISMGLNGSMKF
jgi:hypothetical protein